MARPLRIQAPGLNYHVMSRGNWRSAIFLDTTDRQRFLKLLAHVVEHFGLRCHAYCLMTNHFHLAVKTSEGNLSRAMKQLKGDYAQWWNRRHRRVGHLFQGRFKAQIVQDGQYLVDVCRYIVLNPVRARMVASPAQWRWSSYRATVGISRPPEFLCCDDLFACLSPNPEDGPQCFREFVLGVNPKRACISRDAVLGDERFVARFQPYKAQASREVPRREARRALAVIFRGAITRAARDAAIVAAYRERHPLADIARFLDLHPSSISKIVSRTRARS
jgi:REP element-mobilizing transposase RayT